MLSPCPDGQIPAQTASRETDEGRGRGVVESTGVAWLAGPWSSRRWPHGCHEQGQGPSWEHCGLNGCRIRVPPKQTLMAWEGIPAWGQSSASSGNRRSCRDLHGRGREKGRCSLPSRSGAQTATPWPGDRQRTLAGSPRLGAVGALTLVLWPKSECGLHGGSQHLVPRTRWGWWGPHSLSNPAACQAPSGLTLWKW